MSSTIGGTASLMVAVTYVQNNGIEWPVDVEVGLSVMEGAVWNHVPGILADCAGDGGCATCHVYIDEPWAVLTGSPSRTEKRTLRFAREVQPSSRLSCQVAVTEALDGLVVRLPARQL